MKKIGKILSNKILWIIVILTIILLLSVFIKEKQKVNLKQSLNDMAVDYYENFYYKQFENLSNKNQRLEKYTNIGIKITLKNLEEYSDKNKKKITNFVNSETKNPCNKYNTMAIIYPKVPYEKKDYEVEIVLECQSITDGNK